MENFPPSITIAGLVFDISTVIMSVFTALLVLLVVFIATRNMTAGVPKGWQNFFEWVIDFIRGIAGQFMDAKTSSKFVTLALTLFLFIFIGNQLGVIALVDVSYTKPVPAIGLTQEQFAKYAREVVHNGEKIKEVNVEWFKSPTSSPSVTFGLAFLVLIYAHILGIRKNPGAYIKHWFEPSWPMVLLHIMEEFIIKPLTLPLRLFGNIFAGEVLIAFMLAGSVFAVSLPLIIWLGYSIFVGAVQAYIFTTLALVYISQKVVDEH
ncbi:F0F1 ATP synthase subunit A [Aneurinibacillus terranovensis]|uniref:F0F1 ATP synthase subunit A n=1 Tax=Aneurinibacillus terranovensis TaxID=278991 RepID=UPI0003F5AD38|nr:F0F1 ATP synthase subunit A [Aneurinibacillus terranovensis]